MQWVINAFDSGIFPMRTVNFAAAAAAAADDDDNEDDDDYIYDDEFYPKGALTPAPKTPGTPPIILEPPHEDQLKEEELKHYLQNNCCRYYQYCLHKYKLVIHLKIC